MMAVTHATLWRRAAKNGSGDPDHAYYGVVCHPTANTLCDTTCIQTVKTKASVIPET